MDKIELMLKEGSLERARSEVQEQNLTVASINGPENFNLLDHHAFSEILDRTDKIVKAASEFDCELLIPVPSPRKDGMSEQTAIAETASILSQMADRYGDAMKLGLEFLGTRTCSINNLNAAVETVRRVGKRNVGLVLDSFHMYLSDSKPSNLRQLGAEQVFLVHVNDAEPGEKSKLTDANRVYPGQGVIDLNGFASALKSIGYRNYLSLELLRPSYWKEDADQVAALGRESLRRVFGI
jgi:2-keto-myo-inositol isomerase